MDNKNHWYFPVGNIVNLDTYPRDAFFPINSHVFAVLVTDHSRMVMYEKYKVDRQAEMITREFGVWPSASGRFDHGKEDDVYIWERRKDLGGHKFRVTTATVSTTLPYNAQ